MRRAVAAALPVTLLTPPLPMPPFEQAMQWHKYRSLDPGLQWLMRLMQDAARSLVADADPPVAPD